MNIKYEVISEDQSILLKDLCNDLMKFQRQQASAHKNFFDDMTYETRLVPSIENSKENFLIIAKDKDEIVGYAYSTIAPKEMYTTDYATLNCDAFFDFDTVKKDDVGCLSQFYIKGNYRNKGIGSTLFDESMKWLNKFDSIDDIFIFVSEGNDNALNFYINKGFKISHEILDGFITVLRNL